MAILVTGDSRPYSVVLKVNDAPIVGGIPLTTVIKAQIVSTDRKKVLTTEPVEILSAAIGSDWVNSKIVVKFPRSSTSSITHQGPALIEVQATFAGEEDDWTWFVDIELVKGNLS